LIDQWVEVYLEGVETTGAIVPKYHWALLLIKLR